MSEGGLERRRHEGAKIVDGVRRVEDNRLIATQSGNGRGLTPPTVRNLALRLRGRGASTQSSQTTARIEIHNVVNLAAGGLLGAAYAGVAIHIWEEEKTLHLVCSNNPTVQTLEIVNKDEPK
jgi:hypothetical protein